MARLHDERGFTLIEILVVMLILGILMAIAIPALVPKKNRANDAAAKTNARSTVAAVESCFTETEDYRDCEPGATPGLDSSIPVGTGLGQIDMKAQGKDSYTVEAYSRSGNVFRARKVNGAPVDRTCTVPASAPDRGGCSAKPNGTW